MGWRWRDAHFDHERTFLAGMNRQITSYLDHSEGSIIVAQKGISNMLGATSLLPPRITSDVEAVDGVNEVIPILSQFIILDLHEKKQPVYLIGYDLQKGGGPWEIAEGRTPETDDEIILDRILAQRHDLVIDDQIEIMGKEFVIVGLSDGTTSWMTSYLFMRKAAVEGLLRAPGAVSFLLVEPANGVERSEVISRLDELDGVNILTKDEMKANDIKLFARIFPHRFD